jgi:2-keto-3-deoxy-L-fuconate dehydrogenase
MISGRLKGKQAIVTGAAHGIGRESALMFVREGANVLATDIDESGLAALARESPKIATRRLDVTDAADIGTVFASRNFDVLFNCAGWVHHGTVLECDESQWRRSFAVNVDSMYRLCRAAIPGMIAMGGGSIVNMSSVVSSIKTAPSRFAYGATKAAVIGLTKAVALDFAHHGIRCNAVCPGTVRTPSLEQRAAASGMTAAEALNRFAQRQPMGRLGEPAEIAALVVFLASDESSFATGGTYVIDGGMSI